MARILQVCNTDFYLNKFLVPLVLGLVDRGHLVECVCEGHEIDTRLRDSGVVIHDFPFPRDRLVRGIGSSIQRMRALIRRGQYDCVNSHNRNASLVARIAGWLERVPANIYTAHGFYFHDDQSRLAHSLTVMLEAGLARITDYTLSQSAEDVDFVVQRRMIRPERIELIGNGIDTRRFSPRFDRMQTEEKLAIGHSTFRVATTGRIVRGKGFQDLIGALARIAPGMPDCQLLMIGGNIAQDIEPFQRELLEEIRASGLESRVRITGIVDNVEEYLAVADVFVLPSYREGMPRSLIEAMSMGLTCIATDIRGCREIISDGQTGYLYKPEDVDALAALLLKCSKNVEERKTVAERARAIAISRYDEKTYVSKQASAIERVLIEAGARAVPAPSSGR